jgi:hypothetical protein
MRPFSRRTPESTPSQEPGAISASELHTGDLVVDRFGNPFLYLCGEDNGQPNAVSFNSSKPVYEYSLKDRKNWLKTIQHQHDLREAYTNGETLPEGVAVLRGDAALATLLQYDLLTAELAQMSFKHFS